MTGLFCIVCFLRHACTGIAISTDGQIHLSRFGLVNPCNLISVFRRDSEQLHDDSSRLPHYNSIIIAIDQLPLIEKPLIVSDCYIRVYYKGGSGFYFTHKLT